MLSAELKLKLEANLRYLTFQKALATAYFHMPILVLFWLDLGLTMFEIMTLQAAFSVATVIFELPSGIFADIYGRKLALTIAAVCNVIGISLYCLADDFFDLLMAEMLFAGFISMQSGADSAFLFDNLKALKREDEFPKLLGNLIFYSTIVAAVANVFGGFIGAVDLRIAIYVSVPFAVAALVASTRLIEPPAYEVSQSPNILRRQIAAIMQTLKQDDGLMWLLIYAGLIFSFNIAGLWFYQPYFSIAGIDVMYFGLIFASMQVVAAYAGKYYYLVKDKFTESHLLLGLTILSCSASIMLGYFVFLFSFTLIFLHQIVRGFYKIIFNDIVNRRVKSNVRASILSIQSMMGRLLSAFLMPFFGWYADVYSIEETFILIGIIGLACSLPVFWLLSRFKPYA